MRRRRIIELAPAGKVEGTGAPEVIAPAPASMGPTVATPADPPRRTRRPKVEAATVPSSPSTDPKQMDLPFLAFVLGFLSLVLSAAQRVFCKVVFDRHEPETLEGAERGTARECFGNVDRFPPATRTVLCWRKGARVGGTWISALVALWKGLTIDLGGLAPGEIAYGVNVGPSIREARQWLRYVVGAAKRHPYIAGMILGETADSLTMKRPDGAYICFECLPAARGGSATRTRTYFYASMDEADFLLNSDFVVNDGEIYRALAPRILPGGILIILSTAWSELSLLADLIKTNFEHPVSGMAAITTTLLMRDDERIRTVVEQELERDEDNARREFFCEVQGAGAAQFFDPATIEACIDADLVVPAETIAGPTHAGTDFGFSSNSSVLAVLEQVGKVHELVRLVEIRPMKGSPLKPSEVGAQFKAVMAGCGCTRFASDAHYRESIREHTSPLTFVDAPAGQAGKAAVFVAARSAMREGRVRLPNDPRLLKQLRQVVSRALPGGGLSISSPTARDGSHGDLVSALVLAIWEATRKCNVDWAATMRELQRLDDQAYAGRLPGDGEDDDEGDGFGVDFWD